MIQMVVFDMAGTTVDEDNVVYKTLHAAIQQAGFPCSFDQVLEWGAGREKLQAIQFVLQSLNYSPNDTEANAIYADFIIRLSAAYQALHIKEIPHANEVMRILRQKNILVVLNTGYNLTTAQTLLHKLGWREGIDFDALITASDVLSARPFPDMIQLAMNRFQIEDPSVVVKVGDSTIDIEEGRNAGCLLNIGITTGAHTHNQLQLSKPDYIINNLRQLIHIVDNFNQETFTQP
ncbi:MAG: HAD-IA family hydrolase [Chitinophagia bacterium]|jgi:phosphonatase-like hydrolase